MVQLLGSSSTMQDEQSKTVKSKRELRYSREVQGNVLAAFNKDHETFRLVAFADAEKGRSWLLSMLGHVSVTADVEQFNEQFSLRRRVSGGDPKDLKATWVSVSLTYDGLKLLAKEAAAAKRILEVEPAFEGAATRARSLGDIGNSDPHTWEFGNKNKVVHAVVTLAADDREDLQDREQCLELIDAKNDVRMIHRVEGRTLPEDLRGHEHFGFKDGVSQPGVRGFHEEDQDGHRLGHPGTEIIKAGEFVLGYDRESGKKRATADWMHNGSFHVVRKLEQDVPGFQKLRKDLADKANVDEDLAGAMLVGRFEDGRPLARPTRERRGLGPDLNDFDYHGDGDGARTPRCAHTRKTNPRAWFPAASGKSSGLEPVKDGDETKGYRQLKLHRILRRGIPYGEVYDKDKDAKGERGLMFVAYCASLKDQFEFQQMNWSNNSEFNPGTGSAPGIDPIIGVDPGSVKSGTNDSAKEKGRCESKFPSPSGEKTLCYDRLARTRGAVYAFTPSMKTLRGLAKDGTL